MELQTKRKNCSAFPSAGEVLPDGTVLELLRDQGCPGKLTLVRYHDGILDTKSDLRFADRVYAPVSLDPSVAKAIRFPSRVAPPETTKSLFTDAHKFLNSHLGQLDHCTTAMVFAIFATWLTPVLPAAPIRSNFVPPGGPKKQLLQVLNLMCRRPLRLVGLKRASNRVISYICFRFSSAVTARGKRLYVTPGSARRGRILTFSCSRIQERERIPGITGSPANDSPGEDVLNHRIKCVLSRGDIREGLLLGLGSAPPDEYKHHDKANINLTLVDQWDREHKLPMQVTIYRGAKGAKPNSTTCTRNSPLLSRRDVIPPPDPPQDPRARAPMSDEEWASKVEKIVEEYETYVHRGVDTGGS